MTRNLKALGLVLLAVCALGAVAAQGASAVNHQFLSDGPNILTGKNINGNKNLQIGAAGIVECTTTELEATAPDEEEDLLTVSPRYSGCTFGGQPATVNFGHCATIWSSDTTGGTEAGKEHANIEIECSLNPNTKIEIHTSVCTITIAPQVIPHALSYEKDSSKPGSATIVKTTAKNIVTGKVRNTATQPANGCLFFPSGAIGTSIGTATMECFNDASGPLLGTEKTTPQGLTKEDGTTECSVE